MPTRFLMIVAVTLLTASCTSESTEVDSNNVTATDAEADTGTSSSDLGTVDGDAGNTNGTNDAGADATADAEIDMEGPVEMIPVIVAAGSNHSRWVSIDEGLTWCDVRETAPDTTDFDNPNLLRNITFTDGKFVTGSWTAIFVSENGYAWTEVTNGDGPAMGQWIAQIEHGNGWWVATGGYGTAMRSADLMTWENTSDSMPGNEASRSLAFGNGKFVTNRDNAGWWESTDGTNWTAIADSPNEKVLFNGTDFVVRPDYNAGRGIRLSGGWPDKILRSADADGAQSTVVATLDETPLNFAFGEANKSDYERANLPAALAQCLGVQ
ncbi:MAG: hypothetical protein R3E66_02135 [bacterium]